MIWINCRNKCKRDNKEKKIQVYENDNLKANKNCVYFQQIKQNLILTKKFFLINASIIYTMQVIYKSQIIFTLHLTLLQIQSQYQVNNMSVLIKDKEKDASITTFSTDDYLMPRWAALPKYKYFFQVLKDGCIISKIQIKNKEFSLIGRLQDLCDIFIDNPTVSRKHAILQFSQESPYPMLYDLGNTHGTCVNKEKLPPRIYKKIQPFANIKFGISSRSYILRCPELQQKEMVQEEQKQNQFIKTLQTQNTKLSKEEMKQKYFQMLQNDPYSGNQLASRKFVGKNNQNHVEQKIDGIDWGISDQNQVYGYKNDQQFPIQTDIMRRLPGLDQIMLDKLADYQQKFRIYEQIQSQLNELANKQKREYGLEEKLQNKKQKLQKRFVQSIQALQKSQCWIRQNIFGDQSGKTKKANKIKQRQADTFSDDQFYDRTLQNKQQKITDQNQNIQKKKTANIQMMSVEDFWQIKKLYQQKLKQKQQIQLVLVNKSIKENENNQLNEDQEDQLQNFMKETNQKLVQQNKDIQNRQLTNLQSQLQVLKAKLLSILGEKQLNKIQTQILNKKKQTILTQEQKLQIKKKEDAQRLQKTFAKLAQLEKQKQMENLSEEDINIFKYYKPSRNEQIQQEEQLDYEEQNEKLKRGRILRNQVQDKIKKRTHTYHEEQNKSQEEEQDQSHSNSQENVYDLTKFS